MRILIPLAISAALAGCSTTPGRFDNVLTISLTGDRAFVSSLYGPVGITAELREADARELQAMREKAALYDLAAQIAEQQRQPAPTTKLPKLGVGS